MAPRQISNKNHRSKNNNYIYLGKIRIDGEKEGKKYQILRFEIVLRIFHGGPTIESQRKFSKIRKENNRNNFITIFVTLITERVKIYNNSSPSLLQSVMDKT